MRLELFDLIDDSVKLLELNNPSYQYVEGAIWIMSSASARG